MAPNSRVVVGAQWGDEGKGKVVDVYGEEADLVVRFAGGNNAGHTLEELGKKLILHLIPSAVKHADKLLILGGGMVIDPSALVQEIDDLKSIDLLQNDTELLRISDRAHLLMPYHIAMDKAREAAAGKSAIGTTGRGIGPAYTDKAARTPAIRMSALRHPKLFELLVTQALKETNPRIRRLGGKTLKINDMITYLEEARKNLLPYIANIDIMVDGAIRAGKNVLFEGAQGAGLDLDHGTYPYVTSSNTLAAAACLGAGIGPGLIGDVIGVSKAYVTRVGNGPFPTKLLGEVGERIRQTGNEYGATTGRPRDCGWMDLPQLRTSARKNGMTGLFITKLDVLRGIHPVNICIAYLFLGRHFINMDDVDAEMLGYAYPTYQLLPGFDEDISNARTFDELPKNAQNILNVISAGAGVPLVGVSVGPERNQTIWIKK